MSGLIKKLRGRIAELEADNRDLRRENQRLRDACLCQLETARADWDANQNNVIDDADELAAFAEAAGHRGGEE